MAMEQFNSDDHYIYITVGKNPLEEARRRKSIPHTLSLKCSTWVQSQKWQNDLSSFQGKPFSIMVIEV